jgi:hypothetical protein
VTHTYTDTQSHETHLHNTQKTHRSPGFHYSVWGVPQDTRFRYLGVWYLTGVWYLGVWYLSVWYFGVWYCRFLGFTLGLPYPCVCVRIVLLNPRVTVPLGLRILSVPLGSGPMVVVHLFPPWRDGEKQIAVRAFFASRMLRWLFLESYVPLIAANDYP